MFIGIYTNRIFRIPIQKFDTSFDFESKNSDNYKIISNIDLRWTLKLAFFSYMMIVLCSSASVYIPAVNINVIFLALTLFFKLYHFQFIDAKKWVIKERILFHRQLTSLKKE